MAGKQPGTAGILPAGVRASSAHAMGAFPDAAAGSRRTGRLEGGGPRGSVLAAMVLCLALATTLFADDLTVDRRTVRIDESVSIVVSLEGAFATNDSVVIPVKNLRLEGPPSVSSEFSWINGATTRRKVLRYSARPLQPGVAIVGPVVVNGEGGQKETLAAIELQIVADTANQSNDPATIVHELLANGREPLFVVTEVDRTKAYVGEEIVVTWILYNAAAVDQWQIGGAPKLDEFWTEEIDVRNAKPEQLMVGNLMMQRVPIRRVAIFPLHSGPLRIGGMGVRAEVMRRIDNGPMALFEGTLVETSFESAAVNVEALPLPAGISADVVGDVSMTCTPPAQKVGGPVAMTATLRGRANLRGVAAPRIDGAVDGDVEVQPVPLSIERTRDGVIMTRKWQYLIAPARSGKLTVPPLASTIFNPKSASAVLVRCGGATIDVTQRAAAVARTEPASPLPLRTRLRGLFPWAAAVLIAVVALVAILPRIAAARRTRQQARSLVRGRTPAAARDAVHALLESRGLDVNAISVEASDRGDAYRAFRSLTDAMEREQAPSDHEGELESRARDLVESLS